MAAASDERQVAGAGVRRVDFSEAMGLHNSYRTNPMTLRVGDKRGVQAGVDLKFDGGEEKDEASTLDVTLDLNVEDLEHHRAETLPCAVQSCPPSWRYDFEWHCSVRTLLGSSRTQS